jgi:hypothetical protein
MRKGTCKFHIGSHHNTHCAAGVEYKSVLSDPNRLEGSAYRPRLVLVLASIIGQTAVRV